MTPSMFLQVVRDGVAYYYVPAPRKDFEIVHAPAGGKFLLFFNTPPPQSYEDDDANSSPFRRLGLSQISDAGMDDAVAP